MRYPEATQIKDEFMLTTSFDANITVGWLNDFNI
jgi:hypothetical protein